MMTTTNALRLGGCALQSRLAPATPGAPWRRARRRALEAARVAVPLRDAAGVPYTRDDLRHIAAALRRSADGIAAVPGDLAAMARRAVQARFIYERARDYDAAARAL